ncbi:MAG: hypothetical protein WCP70_02670 [Methanothrix sp.]
MNNIKKGSSSEGLNGKLAYEPPMALRLDDMREGEGTSCSSSGSGNATCQTNGNLASSRCSTSGNSGPSGPS